MSETVTLINLITNDFIALDVEECTIDTHGYFVEYYEIYLTLTNELNENICKFFVENGFNHCPVCCTFTSMPTIKGLLELTKIPLIKPENNNKLDFILRHGLYRKDGELFSTKA